MDLCSTLLTPAPASTVAVASSSPHAAMLNDAVSALQDYASLVDPFLVEALQNPRHRLTILRMELDIKRFLQNSYQEHFEFPHFPTSYLRLAAHRVAQHYGLQTIVQDNCLDGQGTRIVVRKLVETKFPAVCLSDIPAKHSENEKQGQVKIVLRSRPGRGSSNDMSDQGIKHNPLRSVEERKEEYDKARARIFNGPSDSVSDDIPSKVSSEGKNLCSSGDENEDPGYGTIVAENSFNSRDACTSRVAIFRDREKDRTDPDYDRSYGKYVRNTSTNQGFGLSHYGMQQFQHPFVQYDSTYPQLGQMLRTDASMNYQSNVMTPFSAFGLNQPSRDAAVYMQWQSQAMMYAQSYDQFRNAVFQVPFTQQPLSLDHSDSLR